MDRVRKEEVRRRAGIERELASRADQRVLRWFGHVDRTDENRTAGTTETEVRLDGWCEGGLGQQGNDGSGCVTMRERSERVLKLCCIFN